MMARIAIVWALAFGLLWAAMHSANGADYAAPDLNEYYASLTMPDGGGVSCCDWGDAYYADKTEECTPADGPDCALVAIITDTRPDKRTLPDGREINRMHIAPGTRIVVIHGKIRKHPIPNPTGHNIVFENSGWFPVALCWEPISGM